LSYVTISAPTGGGTFNVTVTVNGIEVVDESSTGTYYFSVCNGDEVIVYGIGSANGYIPIDYLIGTTFGSNSLYTTSNPIDQFVVDVPTDTTCDCGSGS